MQMSFSRFLFSVVFGLVALASTIGAKPPVRLISSFEELKVCIAGNRDCSIFEFRLSCKPDVLFSYRVPGFIAEDLRRDILSGHFPSLVGTDFLASVLRDYADARFIVHFHDEASVVMLVYSGIAYDVTNDFIGEGFCSVADRRK